MTTEDDRGARIIERFFDGLMKYILQFSGLRKLPFLQGGIPKSLREKWVFLCYNNGVIKLPGRSRERATEKLPRRSFDNGNST